MRGGRRGTASPHGRWPLLLCLVTLLEGTNAATPSPTPGPTPSPTPAPTGNPTAVPTAPLALYIHAVQSFGPDGAVAKKQLFGPIEGHTLLKVAIGSASAAQGQWAGTTFKCRFTGYDSGPDVQGTAYTVPYSHDADATLNDGSLNCRTPLFNATVAKITVLMDGVEQGGSTQTFYFTFFASLLVSDLHSNCVRRFVADTGDYWDDFIIPGPYKWERDSPASEAVLRGPRGIAFGLSGGVYISSERTDSVLLYDGSSGSFKRTFCRVAKPGMLTFHHADLYVVSRGDNRVYRYQEGYGIRYVYIDTVSSGLTSPGGLIFDKLTDTAYLASEASGHVLTYRTPADVEHSAGLHKGQMADFDKVWTDTRVVSATGLVFTVDSLYVTGPSAGGVVRFNRTNGNFIHHFEDPSLREPTEIREYKDYVYVLGTHEVRKYNRLNGEFIRVHLTYPGMVAANFVFHADTRVRMGE